MEKKVSKKTSVRIAITREIGAALEYLKNTKYPFMKEDELFKIAFSRFYSDTLNEYLLESAAYIFFQNIQDKDPDFGKEYLEEKGVHPKQLMISDIVEMVLQQKNKLLT